jgi:hypothetical protein
MKSLRATATASSFALLVIVCAYLFVIIRFQRAAETSGWITGDWLINYSDGFVRRGAVGEMCRRLYEMAAIDPVSAIIAVKAFCYAALSAALLMLAIRRTISALELALFLSPAALPFEIYDPLGSGRKEIVLLAAFAIYLVTDLMVPDDERSFVRRWRFWYLLVALPVLTLIHEGLFFFLPFFLAYEALKRDLRREAMLVFGIPLSVAAIAFVASFMYRGENGVSAAMCSSLSSMSLDPGLCAGAITALEHYDVYIGLADVTRYVVLGMLTFGPLLWYATQVLDSARYARLRLMVVAVVFTLPLYLFSEDWGRWMHITAMLILVIVLACKDTAIRLPAERPVFAVVSFIAASVYVIAWHLPHWIHSPLPMVRAVL